MKNKSEMFKFTQLRPVNGIEINRIRKKHIPLYKEGHVTELLKNMQGLGLSKGLTTLLEHIQSSEFQERLAAFNRLSSEGKNKDTTQISLLVLVLQKAIDISETFSTLDDAEDANLKTISGHLNALVKSHGITAAKIKTEFEKLTQADRDQVADDCYSLLMQSAYYPEYRRYLVTMHRFIYMSDENTLDAFYTILFPKDSDASPKGPNVLRRFLKGRILLPQNVKKDSKPLPTFLPDDISSSENDIDEGEPKILEDSVVGFSALVQKTKTPKVFKQYVYREREEKMDTTETKQQKYER